MLRHVVAALVTSGLLVSLNPAEAAEAKSLPWAKQVSWKTWDEGVAEAKRTNKPICLVVYTTWCPRCRELAPVFDQAEVAKLSRKFVMIHQDRDKGPAWMKKYASTGTYIPRVLFLDSKGKLRTDITSGSAKYPFFYSNRSVPALTASMTRALESR